MDHLGAKAQLDKDFFVTLWLQMPSAGDLSHILSFFIVVETVCHPEVIPR